MILNRPFLFGIKNRGVWLLIGVCDHPPPDRQYDLTAKAVLPALQPDSQRGLTGNAAAPRHTALFSSPVLPEAENRCDQQKHRGQQRQGHCRRCTNSRNMRKG